MTDKILFSVNEGDVKAVTIVDGLVDGIPVNELNNNDQVLALASTEAEAQALALAYDESLIDMDNATIDGYTVACLQESQLDGLYLDEIRSWYWNNIYKEALNNLRFEEDTEQLTGYAFIGTIFSITPSGKIYTPFACSNVTEAEALLDEIFNEDLEAVASEHGMFISHFDDSYFASIVVDDTDYDADTMSFITTEDYQVYIEWLAGSNHVPIITSISKCFIQFGNYGATVTTNLINDVVSFDVEAGNSMEKDVITQYLNSIQNEYLLQLFRYE